MKPAVRVGNPKEDTQTKAAHTAAGYPTRHTLSRTPWVRQAVLVLGAVLAVACGGASEEKTDSANDKVAKTDKDPSTSSEDAGTGSSNTPGSKNDGQGNNGGLVESDPDDPDEGKACTPETCEDLEMNCGPVSDGCGGLLDCGECDSGSECGIVSPNTCTKLEELCKPAKKSDACKGKACGETGDGCGGIIECGTCDSGQSCGVKKAFQCSDSCQPKVTSCAEANVECGKIGDGCGRLLDCDDELGGCAAEEFCGVLEAQQCDPLPGCQPLTPEVACKDKCGMVSNGCGVEVDQGLIDCSQFDEYLCPEGMACGASGVPGQCGNATGSCTPLTSQQACAALECGVASDGCDGSVSCGDCDSGDLCRDGSCVPSCVPASESQACAGKQCGAVSDGCGGSHDCGSCGANQQCGFLEAFQCGDLPPVECVPQTPAVACQGRECGTVYDGCGTDAANVIDCATLSGGCAAGEFCGIVESFQCDVPPGSECTPAGSCAALGYQCGYAVDCGNLLDCTAEGLSCDAGVETCVGGIDGPTECVSASGVPGGADCDVCDSIPDCSGAAGVTQLTGRVITPGKTDGDTENQVGVPNAFVYILRSSDESVLPTVDSGIPNVGGDYGTSCDRCADQDLGPVLVSDTTDALGNFTLDNKIPVGEEFVLVVKIGKWRRAQKYTVGAGGACTSVSVPSTNTRLPRSMNDGLMVNIPHIAVSTGLVDAMECLFYKMGVGASEFSQPGANGDAAARIHMYRSGDDGGASMADGSTSDTELYQNRDRIFNYDMLVFDCAAAAHEHNSHDPKIREFVNRGGRMFASHWSYSWLHDNGSSAYSAADPYSTGLSTSANWGEGGADDDTGWVSVGRPGANASKIQNFADWLEEEGAATLDGQGRYAIDITDPRDLVSTVNTHSEEFVYRSYRRNFSTRTSVQQYAFNTPYGAPEEALCGRVAYSGFHVVSQGGTEYDNAVFPAHCGGDLTDQEKVLLYMLFDLGACVTTEEPEPPSCTPVSDCTGRCGVVPDGCGGSLDCSTCAAGLTCLSGGVCDTPECIPATCQAEGATCGLIADGCGGLLTCGDCPAGQECGLVTLNQCTVTCTPTDAQTACEGACGFTSDGCGNVHECPDCGAGLTCVEGECTTAECDPLTACPPELECGVVSDGCAGTINCGECALPEVCGGGGTANACGVPSCEPLSCSALGVECGWIGDGCGAATDCGECPMGQACGLGGQGLCGGCTPASCSDVGAECGSIGDGCGGVVQCGDCPAGQICGATEANKCGTGTECSPQSCGDAGAQCGTIGDGCGGTVNCGTCPQGQLCGVNEAFQCGAPPSCEPTSCEAANAECGALGDGCGGLLNCGSCAAGKQCGILSPNQCAVVVSGPR